MGLKNYERKKNRLPPFLWVERAMFDSEAFHNLSASAIVVLFNIVRERKERFHGTREHPIVRPYSQFRGARGLSSRTISKALRELEAAGFIEIVKHGGLEKNANAYVLSEKWRE